MSDSTLNERGKMSFKDRLRLAARQHAKAQPQPAPPSTPPTKSGERPPLDELLQGYWRDTELGPVFIRDVDYAITHRHGDIEFDAIRRASPPGLRAVLHTLDPPAPTELGFFDLETTGLSGGTGTYFFLAGLGWFTADGFRVRQYFLDDVRSEPALLSAMVEDLKQFRGLVTYNGRSFDLPLVETRLLLARQPSPLPELENYDLLYAVRRLFRHRLASCRLSEAEDRLVGFRRDDDTPGWMAPSIYFDYLRAGRIGPVRGILRHNVDDILSTAALLARVVRVFETDDLDPRDTAALARWWEHAAENERAQTLYRRALPELANDREWDWAAFRHALLCKRGGKREEAAKIWDRLWRRGDRRAGLELAKHLEHHRRDLQAAMRVTRELLEEAESRDEDALTHRMRRLERKHDRRSATGLS